MIILPIMNLEKNFVVKTSIDDKEHEYFTEFSYDKSIDDCMGTATLKCPWNADLMSYWEPITQTVGVKGGVYDDHWLFIGRVDGLKTDGQEIEIQLQDIGWKFKQTMPQDFYNDKVKNKGAAEVVRTILDYLKFDGKFVIFDSTGYGFDEDGNLKYNNEDIKEIRNVYNAIANLKSAYNKDPAIYNVDNEKGKISGTTKSFANAPSTIFIPSYPEVLKDYTESYVDYTSSKTDIKKTSSSTSSKTTKNLKTISVKARTQCACCDRRFPYRYKTMEWVNLCTQPTCSAYKNKKYGTLKIRKDTWGGGDDEFHCTKCGADFCAWCGGDKDKDCYRYKLIPANKTAEENQKGSRGGIIRKAQLTGDSAFTEDEATTSIDIKAGEKTFEDVIKDICEKLDLVFIVRHNSVYIASFEVLYQDIEQLEQSPLLKRENIEAVYNIQEWQIENDSFKFEVTEFGYYNTVYVKYKNGTVKESYEDLVRVFGEAAKTYTDKKIDKSTATLRAKAYLSAHLRDFGMKVEATIIGSGRFFPGTFCKIPNPLTGNIERYFISDVVTDWKADDGLQTSLTLLYGPKNPDNPEIPEVGDNKQKVEVSANSNSKIKEIRKDASKFTWRSVCGDTYWSCIAKNKIGDCYAMSNYLWHRLTYEAGVKAQIVTYRSSRSRSGTHRTVEVYNPQTKKWEDFDYSGFKGGFGVIPGKPGRCVFKHANGKKGCSKPR